MDDARREKTRGFPFDTVFAGVLFCMFTVAALLLAVSGGNIYKSIADDLDADYLARTALSYVAGKNRYDAACVCSVSDEGGGVLSFSEDIGGERYETLIWFENGELRERFAREGEPLERSGGAAILSLDSFSASLDGPLLTVSVSAGGVERASALCVNPAKEATP